MVRILEFRRPEATEPPKGVGAGSDMRPEGHSAEIIIFPGVRIDRHSIDARNGDESKQRVKRARSPYGRNR